MPPPSQVIGSGWACPAGSGAARWGASAVPADWRALCHGYPGITGEELVDLALEIVGPRIGV